MPRNKKALPKPPSITQSGEEFLTNLSHRSDDMTDAEVAALRERLLSIAAEIAPKSGSGTPVVCWQVVMRAAMRVYDEENNTDFEARGLKMEAVI